MAANVQNVKSVKNFGFAPVKNDFGDLMTPSNYKTKRNLKIFFNKFVPRLYNYARNIPEKKINRTLTVEMGQAFNCRHKIFLKINNHTNVSYTLHTC